ncbi:hypothetical protein A1O3_08216 [Capronia epimyces CBS 606.96]|uniref:Cytochrome P450 oxidoreductase n=1 Tax=Capronia epimyces CBS 606.96 TaxID=1182542 RepID=W9XSJ2_9EURO|nr:uncharacterized protein A1O3_08216 [Capronia epimyces CBS 606.96]EXJ79931.1 hypothetical protein A1O3_08216 [Capronia epimyces CBS 606.96]
MLFDSLPTAGLSPATVAVVAIVFLVGIYRLLQVGKRDPRLPPGPPTIPILGNLHQVPITGLHKQFRTWAEEYGPVYSLKFGPSTVIVLCSRESVHQLLDKKGAIYSDRPSLYIGDMLTKGDHMALTPANTVWREKRKIVTHNFSPKMLDEKHFRIQEAEATVLMNDLLAKPDDFIKHVRRYTASVANCIIYGQRAATYESFWGHVSCSSPSSWSEAMEPGANPPVDIFPFIRYIPESMAFWKRRALDAGKTMDDAWREGRERVERRRARGIKRDSIVDACLDEYKEKGMPFSQHAFDNLMGEILEGAADTTASQLCTLIMAFTVYPEVQEKAREEIDRVCGSERAPGWSDFKDLPYINAIVKEGMRWRPTSATALPHYLREDDWYNGMLIPKGSTVFLPVWAVHHSEGIYEDAERFNPDRYAGMTKLANDYAGSPDYEKRDHYGYGAGRRICPGIHLAERNMWRIAAKLLWAFEFHPVIDQATGKPVPIDTEAYTPGIAQFPLPFAVDIKCRSERHRLQITKELDDALALVQQFE